MKQILFTMMLLFAYPCLATQQDWIAQAEKGNPQAQYRIGKSYLVGDTIKKDISKALFWIEKAVAQQEPRAEYLLGLCYYKGEGKEKNDSLAYQNFKRSALQGYPLAQYSLALRYLRGEGTSKNQSRAFHWFRKASEGGVMQARYSMGVRLQKGEGVDKHPELALSLYRELALQTPHDPFFDYFLGYSLYYGTCGRQDRNEGSRHIQRAAINGCIEAQSLLTQIRQKRENVPVKF
ncbi:sel1 repeat family protein [Halosquirtibacter laminarini]|uniref:Sel1 repeat family protein n=1 Tax=Halosquirtibacter laminarini TaxID=3374600 RepID=A0AC61NL47_9BACT|nr:sel1 repeat family protein [Prolixibacteraceae bacterium]